MCLRTLECITGGDRRPTPGASGRRFPVDPAALLARHGGGCSTVLRLGHLNLLNETLQVGVRQAHMLLQKCRPGDRNNMHSLVAIFQRRESVSRSCDPLVLGRLKRGQARRLGLKVAAEQHIEQVEHVGVPLSDSCSHDQERNAVLQ
jgi:hypothetical protein